jgi:hypothetical protein
MNNHEYLSKQMKITLGILQSSINKASISQAQKNKLHGLITELGKLAYQVGWNEGLSGQAAGFDGMFRYPEQFDDTIQAEPQIRQLVIEGQMTDASSHNDAAAHFERKMADGNVLLLWIAEEIRAEREYEDMPRYTVELAGSAGPAGPNKQRLLSTEDTDEAVRFVRELIEGDLKQKHSILKI